MMHRSVEEIEKAMLSATILGRNATRLIVATTITLLLTLMILAMQASPAFAQDETLTVTKTGVGTVTSDPAGINCGDDCSEPYPSSTEQICIENGSCRNVTTYQSVTLTATPAPGWALQSWSDNCSGTGTTCTVTVNEANESVNATFTRISPPNDDFANAQPISGASTSVNGTTKDATRENGELGHSAAWAGEHTVWYSWTAPHTGEWDLDTCQANIDSILAVYTGDQLGSLTKIRDDNNGCSSGFGSKLTFRATAGTTYRIVVGDAGGAMENTFTLALAAIPPPPNDNFDNAQLINGASVSVSGTNVSATRESSDPWGGTTNAERSVWYRWTAPVSGSATVDTCTANYDTLLSVSTSRSFGLVTSANNGCSSGFGDKLTFNAQKDQTYYIGVDGCCGAPAGTFTLALELVDDVAPDTRITQGPDDGSATSNTSVTFTFGADEPGSTFKCRVYPAALTPPAFDNCSGAGTHTASGFSPGTYSFEVRATDVAGNDDPTPAKRTFTVDTTAPAAPTITSPANNSSNNTGTITLSGTAEANSMVEVFDDTTSKGTTTADSSGAWSKTLSAVSNSSHTYTAKAEDAAGNISAASPPITVTVDTAPPNTTITSGPTSLTRSTSVSFGFSSNETGASFECKLDGGDFAACASPKSYSGLSNGSHTFSVRAKDAAGNEDATPAVRTWTVDTIKPKISGMSPRHKAIIRDRTPTIRATVKDNRPLGKAGIKLYVAGKRIPAAKFKYSASGLLVYNSPKLSKGKKTVKIVVRDAAGNVGMKSWYFKIR